jgi:hypothetical protein
MDLSNLTTEQHASLEKLCSTFEDDLGKLVGTKIEMAVLVHKCHADGEKCEGTSVLSVLTTMQTISILVTGLKVMQESLVAQMPSPEDLQGMMEKKKQH